MGLLFSKKTKKPIWKKRWIWGLIVICFFFTIIGKSKTPDTNNLSIEEEKTLIIEESIIEPSSQILEKEEIKLEEEEETTPIIEEEAVKIELEEINNSIEETPPSVIRYVFITRTGEKYHSKSCGSVKGKTDLTEMTKDEAVAAGYSACGKCKP